MFLHLQAGQTAVDVYDAFQPDPGPEADFWAGLFSAGSKIILLPARTGELAAALASRGLAVTAVDNSSEFLRVGTRRHLPAAGSSLSLVPAEYSRLRLPLPHRLTPDVSPSSGSRQWDGAVIVREGFSLLEGATAIKNAARGLVAHLKPGAPLFVQFRPCPDEEPPRGRWLHADFHEAYRPHLVPGWKVERAVEEWWTGQGRLRRVEIFRADNSPAGSAAEQRWRHVEERFLLSSEHLTESLHDGGFRSIELLPEAGWNGHGAAAGAGGSGSGVPSAAFPYPSGLPGYFGPTAIIRAEAPGI